MPFIKISSNDIIKIDKYYKKQISSIYAPTIQITNKCDPQSETIIHLGRQLEYKQYELQQKEQEIINLKNQISYLKN